jgi:hypothetical protein
MRMESHICILGYALTAALIMRWSGGGLLEWMVAWAGAVPVGVRCGMLDAEGR